MSMVWSDVEVACLKKLSEIYERGETVWRVSAGWESIGLTAENCRPVLNLLQDRAYIDWPYEEQALDFSALTHIIIRGGVVDVVRDLAEQERLKQGGKDLVESFKATMRKHPVWGPVLIAGGVLTVIITAVNQFVSLLKTLGAF